MEKGSRGPAVNLILAILAVYAREVVDTSLHGIDCDGIYGDTGVHWMRNLQNLAELEVDGGCGPQTREYLKERYHFDFEAAARAMGGTNVFVQPDGTEIIWSPNLVAKPRLSKY
ncbi:MAG: hypothetical protein HYS51_02550 [Candidatus Zambryskibacteria bacterium]|nr:hypothetical protein [Candidatus Zambryskibacteria bacterium]